MPTLAPSPAAVKPAPLPLGAGILDAPPAAILAPSSADRRLLDINHVAIVPTVDYALWADNGTHAATTAGHAADALPLIDAIRRDADAFRSRGTPLAQLYADALSRLADMAHAVDADRPGDVYDRFDAADRMRSLDASRVAYTAGFGAGALSEIDSACR